MRLHHGEGTNRPTSGVKRPRRALALLVAITFAGAGGANAQGLHVAWDQCGDAGATTKSFACGTNAGSETLVVSFLPTFDFPNLGHADIFLHVCLQTNAVPEWWRLFGTESCRYGALTVSSAEPSGSCAPIWDPTSGSAQSMAEISGIVLNGLRFTVSVSASDPSRALDVVNGQELELVRLVLDHTRTDGAGSCAGCNVAANIGAEFVWFYSTDGQNLGTSSSPSVTWQDPSMFCRAVTRTRTSTWGQLKSLYR